MLSLIHCRQFLNKVKVHNIRTRAYLNSEKERLGMNWVQQAKDLSRTEETTKVQSTTELVALIMKEKVVKMSIFSQGNISNLRVRLVSLTSLVEEVFLPTTESSIGSNLRCILSHC